MGLYSYKMIKSSWGISITLDAETELHHCHVKDCVQVNERLCVINRSENISKKEMDFLLFGVRLVARQVFNAVRDGECTAVVIYGILHNFVDFQEEGVACAIMGFLSERFGFSLPETNVEYDPVLKRYIFDFPRNGDSATS